MPKRTLPASIILLLCACLATASAGEKRKISVSLEKLDWKTYLGTSVWYGLYMKNKKCGYMHTRISEARRDGSKVVRFDIEVQAKIQAMGLTMTIGSTDRRDYSPDTGSIVAISSTVQSPLTGNIQSNAVPDGDKLKVTRTVSGKTTVQEVPMPAENLGARLALQALVGRKDVRVGDTVESEGFEPTFLAVSRTVAEVTAIRKTVFRGIPVEVVEIVARNYTRSKPGEGAKQPMRPELPDSQQTMKVDRSGRMLEGSAMGMFTFRLESEANAKKLDKVSDIMMVTSVPLGRRVPKARTCRKVVLAITGMPESAIVNTPRQKYEAGGGKHRLTLTVDPVPAETAPLTADEKKKMAEHLKPTAFLQSDDPRIRKLSADTIGGQSDPYKAAVLLNKWVHRNIEKKFTPVISNALDTLKTRRGDCGEHAALFVALCRAAGIPAREVAGLAYTETGGGILGGHAWAEIYAGGKWYTFDPTFGQANADPLHIKVAEGGMSGMGGMLRLTDLMSKIKVKVASVE